MTPLELVKDLRTRINPMYATQIGTESYERRLCAEAIEELLCVNAELLESLKETLDEGIGWFDECRGSEPDELEWVIRARAAIKKMHSAKGRYHMQLATCDLYDLVGLSNTRPEK